MTTTNTLVQSKERTNIDIRNNSERIQNWNQSSACRASKFQSFNIWPTKLSQKKVIGTSCGQ